MKIQLRNFGPIDFFEFDTQTQMHFIFGENNIGKSYAISAVYLILKNLAEIDILSYYGFHTDGHLIDEQTIKPIKNIVHNKIESKIPINVTEEIKDILLRFFPQTFLMDLTKSFETSFDSMENLSNGFSKKQLTIHIKFESVEFIIGVSTDNNLKIIELKLYFDIFVNFVNTNRSYEYGTKAFRFFYNKKNNTILDLDKVVNIFFGRTFSEISHNVGYVYFLPASRSGLYNALSTFGAIFAELSQSRTFLRSKIELPNISEPVSDYFLNLSSIRGNEKKPNSLLDIAAKIEQNLLKGEVVINPQNKKLSYSPNNLDINLDLSFTSSMISEIAPIVAHLKYIIKEKHNPQEQIPSLLFIEEPEAHLHPKIQVELMKLFVLLSKSGVKVIVTSHSNYLFNKLSNLILAKEIDTNSVEVYHFKMGENGSYVDKNSMKIDVEGIEDANFSEIAEELYAERLELYENLEL